MTSSHKRRMLIIGILGVLFAAGGGCLAYLATASSGTTAAGSGAERASGTGPSGLASPDGAPRTGSSSDDDTAPPRPGRSIDVTGVDLGGDGGIDCIDLINENAQVSAKVTSVGVSGEIDVISDPSGCQGEGPGCAGARLAPGATCKVGLRLPRDEASGPYDVTVTLGLHATCTSARPIPCNEVAGRSPSAANPIGINWTGSLSDSVDLTEPDGADSPPVDEQETPDIQGTPDTQETPESATSSVPS